MIDETLVQKILFNCTSEPQSIEASLEDVEALLNNDGIPPPTSQDLLDFLIYSAVHSTLIEVDLVTTPVRHLLQANHDLQFGIVQQQVHEQILESTNNNDDEKKFKFEHLIAWANSSSKDEAQPKLVKVLKLALDWVSDVASNSTACTNLIELVGEIIMKLLSGESSSISNQIEYCAEICSLLSSHHKCIYGNHLHMDSRFIFTLVQKTSEAKPDVNDINFVQNVSTIVGVVETIWKMNSTLVNPCIRKIIENIEYGKESSIALSHFLDGFSAEDIYHYLKDLSKDCQMMGDRRLHGLLATMLLWLAWPTNKHSHLWVLEFIRRLEDEEKVDILLKFAQQDLSKVFILLFKSEKRDMAWPIVAHTLKMFPSSSLFTQGLHPFIMVLNHWEKQHQISMCQQDKIFIDECVVLIHCLMLRFPDEVAHLQEVQQTVQRFPKPSEYELKRFFGQNLWYNNDYRSSMATNSVLQLRSVEKERVGLENLGMTCYLNSVAQCLYMMPELRNYLFKFADKWASNGHPVSYSCAVTFAFMQYTVRSTFKPAHLIDSTRPKYFQDGNQEDSSEYLKHLLDCLNDEAIAISKQQQEQGGSNENNNNECVEFEKDKVKELFYGVHRTCRTCSVCNNHVVNDDVFNTYILYIKSKQAQTSEVPSKSKTFVSNSPESDVISEDEDRDISQLLRHSLQDEVMDDDNKYDCEHCQQKTRATTRFSFGKLPKYLLLHLALFTYEDGSLTKKMEKIKLVNPLRVTNADGKQLTYELVSVMVHVGSHAISGHYYCYSRDYSKGRNQPLEDQSWIVFDDTCVSYIKYDDMIRDLNTRILATPYVVCYRHVSTDDDQVQDPVLPENQNLYMQITRDNDVFRKECDTSSKDPQRSSRFPYQCWNNDNRKPPPSCGGGGFGSGPRLVF